MGEASYRFLCLMGSKAKIEAASQKQESEEKPEGGKQTTGSPAHKASAGWRS